MYTRKEASRLQEEFWTTFGKYIAPIPSAEGLPINWINYKTGIKHLTFFMEGDSRKAAIGIQLTHPDPEIQQMFFEKFEQQKEYLTGILQEEWTWKMHLEDQHGRIISRIYTELSPVNLYDREKWPELISFFKPRIIALDEFWSDAKYSFEELS